LEGNKQPTVEQVLKAMAEKHGEAPRPMVLMSRVIPQWVPRQAAEQKFVFDLPHVPGKYKQLLMIATTIGAGNHQCTKTQIMLAKKAGLSNEEIGEAILVARYALASTTFNTALDGLEVLVGNEDVPREPAKT
jgi:alkylhydroperoxidase/carboxymuconolactone decarboxylase family protein YurZ